MKIFTVAALLLLMTSFLLPQVTEAGKPVVEDCEFVKLEKSACTDQLFAAHETVGILKDAFISKNADKNYIGLRCKLARAEVKMAQKKPGDALMILEDSINKIWTLLGQRKLKTYDDTEMLAASFENAKTCVVGELTK